MIAEDHQHNYDLFRDCFSTVLIERITRRESSDGKRRRRDRRKGTRPAGEDRIPVSDHGITSADGLGSPEELADFVDFTADQTFEFLPEELKTIQHYDWVKDHEMQGRYQLPLTSADVADLMPALDPAIEESLSTYGIVEGAQDDVANNTKSNKGNKSSNTKNKHNPQGILQVLAPVLSAFITTISTPPPPPISTKQAAQEAGCEMCGRDWVNLTYHHLIPRFVHDKAVKRGWHREEDLQNVAWLCAACHRFVHRFASHEELARHYYTVDLLMEEESIAKWADWVGRLRWKGR